MAMQHHFKVGEKVIMRIHGQPKAGHVVRLSAQRITATVDDGGAIYQFRVSDHGLIGWGGRQHIAPFDQTEIDTYQRQQALTQTRHRIFGNAGHGLSPEHWSSDSAVMERIADALETFLLHVQTLGVKLDTMPSEWLAQRQAEKGEE